MKTATFIAGLVVVIGGMVAGVMSVKRPQPAPKTEPASQPARVEPTVTVRVPKAPPEPDAIPSPDRVLSGGSPKPEHESVRKPEAAVPAKPGKQPNNSRTRSLASR